MSIHSENVTAALANHKAYFGESTASANRVEYRESDRCEWRPIDGAVVHGEFIATVRTGQQYAKATKRHVFVDAGDVPTRIHAHVRIGGCDMIYTVIDITRKGSRLQLHLQRVATIETTRPDYRTPSRR